MDAVVDVTKDHLVDVTTDVATILVSGLFYSFYSVVTEMDLAEADATMAVVMIAAYGSSFFYSSVAVMDSDGAITDVEITVDVAATTIAAKTLCVTGNSCHTFIM